MTIRVGDKVGFYKQLSINEHELEYLEGTVARFVNSETVEVHTGAGTFTVALSGLTKIYNEHEKSFGIEID